MLHKETAGSAVQEAAEAVKREMAETAMQKAAVPEKTEQKAAEAAKPETVLQHNHGETVYLFTTKTCPNCRIAKQMLANEDYVLVDAEESPELVAQFGIRQAPTLVVAGPEQTTKYVNASNIKKYVDQRRITA